MKISIVIAYYNRRDQFLKTLESILAWGKPEIIVVDDASTERIDDIKEINLIRIEPKDKWWLNPCIPYNIGFSKATGDVIIIQNPECIHVGNILKYAGKLKSGRVFSFGAYSLDYNLEYEIYDYLYLKKLILSEPQRCQVAHHGWYNHSVYRPEALHFCNAITRQDLKKIGGFDEQYAYGVGHDDNDMVMRIKKEGIDLKIVDNPFVIHQKHKRTDYSDPRIIAGCLLNTRIFERTSKEKMIKPLNNKYYN
jgi:glycosyltransferase involved in cell wall biosynthesis